MKQWYYSKWMHQGGDGMRKTKSNQTGVTREPDAHAWWICLGEGRESDSQASLINNLIPYQYMRSTPGDEGHTAWSN